MADEMIDICDENNNIVGQGMKSGVLARGLWHRTARVFIYDSAGRILLQLRAKDKELFAGLWDVGAAGHVAVGEEYAEAAIREAKEELGIDVKKDDLNLLMIEKCQTPWGNIQENVFAATYLVRVDREIKEFKIQEKEVQTVRFISADALETEQKNNPGIFTPHGGNYWSLLVDEVKKLTKK